MADSPTRISFPKSGRTWLRAMLRAAGAPLPFTHAGQGSRREELGRPFAGVPAEHHDRPVLFLHRNPLDTAVSFYFQVTRRDFGPGTLKWLQRVLPLWISGRLPLRDVEAFALHPTYGVEAVCRFNRAWIDHLMGRDDSMIVSYKVLRAAPVEGLAAILRFLGQVPAGVEAAVERASFERMRERDLATPPKRLSFLRPTAPTPTRARSAAARSAATWTISAPGLWRRLAPSRRATASMLERRARWA